MVGELIELSLFYLALVDNDGIVLLFKYSLFYKR